MIHDQNPDPVNMSNSGHPLFVDSNNEASGFKLRKGAVLDVSKGKLVLGGNAPVNGDVATYEAASNNWVAKPPLGGGGGGGGVQSLTSGTGIAFSTDPNPITTTGSISLDFGFVTPSVLDSLPTNIQIDGAGRVQEMDGSDFNITSTPSTSKLGPKPGVTKNCVLGSVPDCWDDVVTSKVELYPNTGTNTMKLYANNVTANYGITMPPSKPVPGSFLQVVSAVGAANPDPNINTDYTTTWATTAITPGAPGSGTVTSIAAGNGLASSPNPITSTGTIELDDTFITPAQTSNRFASFEVDGTGRIAALDFTNHLGFESPASNTGTFLYNNSVNGYTSKLGTQGLPFSEVHGKKVLLRSNTGNEVGLSTEPSTLDYNLNVPPTRPLADQTLAIVGETAPGSKTFNTRWSDPLNPDDQWEEIPVYLFPAIIVLPMGRKKNQIYSIDLSPVVSGPFVIPPYDESDPWAIYIPPAGPDFLDRDIVFTIKVPGVNPGGQTRVVRVLISEPVVVDLRMSDQGDYVHLRCINDTTPGTLFPYAWVPVGSFRKNPVIPIQPALQYKPTYTRTVVDLASTTNPSTSGFGTGFQKIIVTNSLTSNPFTQDAPFVINLPAASVTYEGTTYLFQMNDDILNDVDNSPMAVEINANLSDPDQISTFLTGDNNYAKFTCVSRNGGSYTWNLEGSTFTPIERLYHEYAYLENSDFVLLPGSAYTYVHTVPSPLPNCSQWDIEIVTTTEQRLMFQLPVPSQQDLGKIVRIRLLKTLRSNLDPSIQSKLYALFGTWVPGSIGLPQDLLGVIQYENDLLVLQCVIIDGTVVWVVKSSYLSRDYDFSVNSPSITATIPFSISADSQGRVKSLTPSNFQLGPSSTYLTHDSYGTSELGVQNKPWQRVNTLDVRLAKSVSEGLTLAAELGGPSYTIRFPAGPPLQALSTLVSLPVTGGEVLLAWQPPAGP